MKKNNMVLSVLCVSLLAACGSTPEVVEEKVTSNIPQWVLNPIIEDGLAASDCVKYSGNFSIDQKMATANARVSLAQQISLNVKSLDKTYSNRTDSEGESTTGSTFSSVSKQITDQKLSGSRLIKSDVVKIMGKEHFCAMVTLSPHSTKDLFDSILSESERKVNPQDEKFLYQEFKAFKAEENLEKEIERLTK